MTLQIDGAAKPGYIPDPSEFIPFEVAPQPLPDSYQQPAYPDAARRAGLGGRVVVQIFVDRTGLVQRHTIISAEPEDQGFQEAVEAVIYGWKFSPAIIGGSPIGVWVQIPINFTLDAGQPADEDFIPEPTEMQGFDYPPQPLPGHYQQPAFPDAARAAGREGMVVVQLYLDVQGDVRQYRIVKAVPDDMGFQQELERVVYSWKFSPALKNGGAVAAWVQVPVKFALKP